MPISEYDGAMARAATTSDVFNAIAERQRREILALLRAGEGPVTELARELGLTQPGTSKHLRVLREVGLVRDRKAGKHRLYGLDARGLRPIHEWTGGFEQFGNESLDRRDAYVQDLQRGEEEWSIAAAGRTAWRPGSRCGWCFPRRSCATRWSRSTTRSRAVSRL